MKITEKQLQILANEVSGYLYKRIIGTTDIERTVAIAASQSAGNQAGQAMTLTLKELGVEVVSTEEPKQHKPYFSHELPAEQK